jgi:hypothetical protein
MSRWLGTVLIVAMSFAIFQPSNAESVRNQIETDWRQQDACRMRQIQEPGIVYFPAEQLEWPGIKADERLRVPLAIAPSLDGRLDDPCWSDAAKIGEAGAALPSFRLCHDAQNVYVAASLATSDEARFVGTAGGSMSGHLLYPWATGQRKQ